MTDTLEIVDLENLLENTLRCVVCKGDAEYLSKMRCCGGGAVICGTCVEKVRVRFAEFAPRNVRCGHCHVVLGVKHTFDEVAFVVPI